MSTSHTDQTPAKRWPRAIPPGSRPSSGSGLARNGLPERQPWHWADSHAGDDAREAEVQARVAAAREQARCRKEGTR